MNSEIATIPSLPSFLLTEILEPERAPAPASVPPPIPADARPARRRHAVYRSDELSGEPLAGFPSNEAELTESARPASRSVISYAAELLFKQVLPAGLSYAAAVAVAGFLWWQFASFGGSGYAGALSYPGLRPEIAATSPAPLLSAERR